ncbi:MAG: glycosyltransferase family 1 protein [Alphaproteobacteria bacterium]|nr:glycosyltransferase family 1 protein [Alphaproteobacteria bacterium]
MPPLRLHIVSFDIPWPPNYGGIIDVFYKIRALHGAGVQIYLHCFEYQRQQSSELERYCTRVFYYRRLTGWRVHLSILPYIVKSRMVPELLNILASDDAPILFEGLHTCGFMDEPRLTGRLKIYRESNIEHHYYSHLCRSERHPGRKVFFLLESLKLFRFQRILRHASLMLAVSQTDCDYLSGRFPGQKVLLMPSFHKDQQVGSIPGRGDYALYHGKLSVAENYQAVRYLINKVWNETMPTLVIAGMDPPGWLIRLTGSKPNIQLVANPSEEEMTRLIREAHVNILVTMQATGLKLKLLNALYTGRFCLVNSRMLAGTSLRELCEVAETPDRLRQEVQRLFSMEFTAERVTERARVLGELYANNKNCNLLTDILTLHESRNGST